MTLVLKIGSRAFPVASLAEASATYSARRDASGRGNARHPAGIVFDGNRVVGHVSFNGTIWSKPSRDWQPGDVPLFDGR